MYYLKENTFLAEKICSKLKFLSINKIVEFLYNIILFKFKYQFNS
jgi:hypothetical protein